MYSKILFNLKGYKPMLWKSKHGFTSLHSYFHHMGRCGRIASTLFHVVSTCLLNNGRNICCLRCITINNWSGCEIPKGKLQFKIEIVACMLIDIEIDAKNLSACVWGKVIQGLTLYLAFMATHLQSQYDFFDAWPKGRLFPIISNWCANKRCNLMEKVISINQFNVKRVLRMDYENTLGVYLKYF